jgi:hypothetical protein
MPPGTQVFTYANFGKETTRGTPVAPTRQLYVDGTGVLGVDPALNFHEDENAGIRTRIRRVTQQSEDVNLKIRTTSGVGYDDLVIPFSQLKGAMTGVGAGADKTWTATPAMTAANNPEAYSVDVGDETQNWRCQYAMWRSFKIGAALGDVTFLEGDLFAQRAIKGAKASPAVNSAIKIPGALWTVKYAATLAGLPGASINLNHLIDWELEVMTGLKWRHYMDGNLYGAQHVETDIAATLSLTVESTALAVSEFYDKWLAQTLDFVRLKATGPTLGASNYSAQVDLPVLYSNVEPIGAEDDGVNLYKVEANLSYDGTSGTSIVPVIVNSLAALP